MAINIVCKSLLFRNGLFLKHVCNNISLESYKVGVCCCNLSTTATENINVTSKLQFNNASASCMNSWKHSRLDKITNACRRFFSSDGNTSSNKLPPLMNFPQIIWPSIVKSIRNFILTTFIVKPYLDRDFNFPDFVVGSKKAVEVVSSKISEGDTKSLEGLVTGEVVQSVQRAVSLMNLSQREQIAVNAEDIYFSFPYQVGIIFNDEDKDQKRFVEVTMVYHTLRGLSQMRSRGEEPPINMGVLPEYRTRISICNYRFIREFTKGVDSDWTINLLNHFKPSDELDE